MLLGEHSDQPSYTCASRPASETILITFCQFTFKACLKNNNNNQLGKLTPNPGHSYPRLACSSVHASKGVGGQSRAESTGEPW